MITRVNSCQGRISSIRFCLCLWLSIGLSYTSLPLLAAQAPPVSAFASLPEISNLRLSPDAQKLVMLRTLGETQHAFVMDLTSGEINPALGADPSQFFINYCDWANNERLLCSIRSYGKIRAGQRYYRYRDGRTTFTRLIAVDADGGNRLQLVPDPVNREIGDLKWNAIDQDNLVSWLPDDADHVLIQLNREDRIRPSVYRLNIYDNELKRVQKFHDNVFSWYSDSRGNLHLAAGYQNEKPVAFSVLGNRLERLDIGAFAEFEQPRVLAISGDGAETYMGTYQGSDYYRYLRVDTKTGRTIGPLYEDSSHDLFGGGLMLDAHTRQPLLIQYMSERMERHWFDEALGTRFEPVFSALAAHHSNVRLVSLRAQEGRAIFRASGSGTAPTYYFYDEAAKDLKRLATAYPDTPDIVDFEVISYEADDGWPITAYLARPAGAGPHPTIVFPHGGPNARDYPNFDYWSQFFVSRGYAVIKPNFRGSIGYGARHLTAGFDQWGLRMQDDVMNALDWMIEEGIADPQRVCVVGGSYGGYVALVAAYKTPERIRCAISFAGVADLEDLKTRWRSFELGELSIARIQSGRSVNENSPIRQVHRIGVPLLIVHGDADRSVMIEQSREFVAALEKAGKPHRYIEQADGDHFLSNQNHRLEFFQAMDEFLAEHLQVEAASAETSSP